MARPGFKQEHSGVGNILRRTRDEGEKQVRMLWGERWWLVPECGNVGGETRMDFGCNLRYCC